MQHTVDTLDILEALDRNTLRRFLSAGVCVATAYGLEVPRSINILPIDKTSEAERVAALVEVFRNGKAEK